MLLLMTVAGEVLLGLLFPGYVGKAHLAVPLFYLALYAVPVALMAQPGDAKQFIKQFMGALPMWRARISASTT